MAESGDLRLMPLSPSPSRHDASKISIWLSRLDILHNSLPYEFEASFPESLSYILRFLLPLTMLQRLPCGKLLPSNLLGPTHAY